jgi:hypothetical protein
LQANLHATVSSVYSGFFEVIICKNASGNRNLLLRLLKAGLHVDCEETDCTTGQAGGPAFEFLDASATTNQGAPSLRPLQGWEPPTYQLGGLRSVLPTLSHRTRKDGAPSTRDTVHRNQPGRGKPGPPGQLLNFLIFPFAQRLICSGEAQKPRRKSVTAGCTEPALPRKRCEIITPIQPVDI